MFSANCGSHLHKRLTQLGGMRGVEYWCLILLVIVISAKLSESTPLAGKYGDDGNSQPSKTENEDQYGHLNMSCLDQKKEYLFDVESKKCYEPGTRGPCNKNMRFNRILRSRRSSGRSQGQRLHRLGECDCNPVAILPLVYHLETEQCYPLYRQSYCPEKHWLIYSDSEGRPVCVPNPCQSEQSLDPKKLIVLLYGQCVALKAHCEPPTTPFLDSSNSDQFFVRFHGNDVSPSCSHPSTETTNFALSNMGLQACRKGFRKDVQGRCRKTSSLTSLNNRSSVPKSTNMTTNNEDGNSTGSSEAESESS